VTVFRIKVGLSCKRSERSILLVFRHWQHLVKSIVFHLLYLGQNWPTLHRGLLR